MEAVNYTTLRDNMKTYMDKVSDNCEAVYVTRKGENRNIVMISEAAYNNLLENVHLMGNKANYDWLMKSVEDYENGNIVVKTLDELMEMENE